MKKQMTVTVTFPEREDCVFQIYCKEEIEPVGSDIHDQEVVFAIQNELDAGNFWAWCQVEIVCEYESLTGNAHERCCSYANEEDFKASAYYEGLCAAAYDDLLEEAVAPLISLGADVDSLMDVVWPENNKRV